eukprot:3479878-Amphidinium_carterae.1
MLHAQRRSREAVQSGTERVADENNMHIAKKEQENMMIANNRWICAENFSPSQPYPVSGR